MSTLIGDGGHARDIWGTLQTSEPIWWGLCPGEQKPWKCRWKQVAHHDDYVDDGEPYIIGINDPQLRAKIAEEIGRLDESWVHPLAHVGPDCSWGPGTHIYHHASLTRATLGSHCQLAPGAVICGDVTIGDRVFIGANATVVNLTTVPDDTFIKAGTVWTGR